MDEHTIVWNDDGHIVQLLLQRDQLQVTNVKCPGDQDRACRHAQTDCVVDWFLATYGLDCHVGICIPEGNLRVAWALDGNPNDLEDSQIWVVSTTDDLFAAWRGDQDFNSSNIQ